MEVPNGEGRPSGDTCRASYEVRETRVECMDGRGHRGGEGVSGVGGGLELPCTLFMSCFSYVTAAHTSAQTHNFFRERNRWGGLVGFSR